MAEEYELDNHASVVIMRSRNGAYLFQLKTPGYPVKPFVGTLCIIGGNAVDEKTPLETLERELYDEFDDKGIAREVFESARESKPVGDFLLTCSTKALARPRPYLFVGSVFYATLDKEVDKSSHGIKLREGGTVAVAVDTKDFETGLKDEDGKGRQFCWGYDSVMSLHLRESGIAVPVIRYFPGISVARLDSGPLTPYAQRTTPLGRIPYTDGRALNKNPIIPRG